MQKHSAHTHQNYIFQEEKYGSFDFHCDEWKTIGKIDLKLKHGSEMKSRFFDVLDKYTLRFGNFILDDK